MSEQQRKQPPQGGAPGSGGRGPGGGPGARGMIRPKNTKKTLLRLLSYLKTSKILIAIALICIIPSAVSGAFSTTITGNIVDYFGALLNGGELVRKDQPTIFITMADVFGQFGMFLAIVLISMVATFIQSKVMNTASLRGTHQLREELFSKMQRLPLSYFDRNTYGDLMSRFTNDIDNVQNALSQSIVSCISSAITFVAVIVLILVKSWQLSWIPALVIVATLLIFKFMGSRSRKAYRAQQAQLGAVNGNVQEMIEGLKVVKAFNHEAKAIEEFHVINEELRDASQDASFYSVAMMPMASNAVNIGYAAATLFCAIAVLSTGAMTVGDMTSFLLLVRMVGQPINQISQQTSTILAALAGAERVFEMMDQEPEADEGSVTLVHVHKNEDGSLVEYESGKRGRNFAWKLPDGTLRLVQGDVRFEHVNFSYVEGKPILKDVSVFAKPGQKIAFVGSTGAGKTTITNLINRFYEIQSGTITFDGIDVKDIAKDSLRRSLGIVLQDTHLFTDTILENIRYGRLEATDEECIAAAKTAGAHSFISKLPDGYQTEVSGDGGNLSQGQRQLLAIARAAVADPPVMILDEATSSIDTRTEKIIGQGMDALMMNRTVFVIAHRLSTVRDSNAIMVIEHGEIIERGDHDELLEQGGRYYQLYTGNAMLE